MNISISQIELLNALNIVSKGVSTRSTLPILSGILMSAKEGSVVFQTTNLDLSVKYCAAALVEEEGKIVVPGKIFADIVKNLPDAAVRIKTDGTKAFITCDTASYTLSTQNADDFPAFPEVNVKQQIEIPLSQFSAMVKRVSRSVSREESKPILTGILVSIEDNVLKMAATDSYRLAYTEAVLVGETVEDFSAVISGSFLNELTTLPKAGETIKLALTENQVVASVKDTVFVNRRLEGNFPAYKSMLVSQYTTAITVETAKLIAGVKRVSLLGSAANSVAVKFEFSAATQTLQLSAVSQDVGSAQEIIPCQVEGEDGTIAVNHSYVLDGLQSISTDMVTFEVKGPMKPGILRSGAEENFQYLVMPTRG